MELIKVMFNQGLKKKLAQTESKLRQYQQNYTAINQSTAIIEFSLDGTILSANTNFLNVTGYQLQEILQQKHQMFCKPNYVSDQK